MKKQIAILGSTGSIGTQALQVIEEHPDLYEVYALTANNRVDLLVICLSKYMQERMRFLKLWNHNLLTLYWLLW